VLVNPERNYAQFLLRTLLPMVIHVIIALSAGYAVGSERAPHNVIANCSIIRSCHTWAPSLCRS